MDENIALMLQKLGVKVSVLHRLPSINHSREIIEHYFFDGRMTVSYTHLTLPTNREV